MAITITLTADTTGAGVDFDAYLAAHFDGFMPYQFPVFLPEEAEETQQILHLDTPTEGQEADTRIVLLEGSDFTYTFSNHSVSGTIDQIRLGTLGAAWDADAQDLALDADGKIGDMGEAVRIAGLNIVNPVGEKGAVHEIVRGMMGGGPEGDAADADPILAHIQGNAHDLVGSTGNDRWTGTDFDDTARGNAGRDVFDGARGDDQLRGDGGRDRLSGGAGRDTLWGGGGNDTLDGGRHRDVLTGNGGADTFLFRDAGESNRDRIRDFDTGDGDVIDLSRIDADSGARGNQDFAFIGDDAFSGTAGELRVWTKGNATWVSGDTDGDTAADFSIRLTGTMTLDADDFLL